MEIAPPFLALWARAEINKSSQQILFWFASDQPPMRQSVARSRECLCLYASCYSHLCISSAFIQSIALGVPNGLA